MTAYNTFRAAKSSKGFLRQTYEFIMWFGPKNVMWMAPILTYNALNLSGIWLNALPAEAGGRNYATCKPDGHEAGGH
jgi:hypothetical protein